MSETPLGDAVRRRGSVMMLFMGCAIVFFLAIGLAIDVSMLYLVKAQLQTAVDGAASGAVRLLYSNANEPEISKEFVKADMPSTFWWTSNLNVTNASITTSSDSTTSTATVSANVTAPTLFMHLLGPSSVNVAATGSATVWNIQPCTLSYPYGSAPALSSVTFNEAIDMQGWGPTFVLPHGRIIAWYNDEHSLTLGVYKVYVTDSSGNTTLTDYSSSFTFNNGAVAAGTDYSPLPVGDTNLSGDQAGTDTAAWTSAYNYQYGRPMWPALFITDITSDPTAVSGDWQQGGTAAIPPNVVYGTWKGVVTCVNYYSKSLGCPPSSVTSTGSGSTAGSGSALVGSGSATAGSGSATTTTSAGGTDYPTITFAEDSDTASNCSGTGSNWSCTGVPDAPPNGWTQQQNWGSEIVWYIDSLGLRPGHAYRLQVMVHDGDQNQSGGDVGEGCMVAKY